MGFSRQEYWSGLPFPSPGDLPDPGTEPQSSLVAQLLKNPPTNAGDTGSIPGSGKSPGDGNGNPFQYSCMENLMDRGGWQARVHGVARVGHNLATKPPPPPQISSYDSAGLSVLQARSSISNTLSGYSKSIPVHISFNIFFYLPIRKQIRLQID